jgi:hypothetical protein
MEDRGRPAEWLLAVAAATAGWRRRTATVLLLAAAGLWGAQRPLSAQNLLTNPGFDQDLSGWATPQGGTAWDGTRDADGNPASGSAAVKIYPPISSLSTLCPEVLSQCVTVTPGTAYNFGGKIFIPEGQPGPGGSPLILAAEIAVVWSSAGNCATPVNSWSPILTPLVSAIGTWTSSNVTLAVAPDHAVSAIVAAELCSPDFANLVAVSFDDMDFEAAPATGGPPVNVSLRASGTCTPIDSPPVVPVIEVSWSAAFATSYQLFRDGAPYGPPTSQTSFADTSIVAGQTYAYFVRASNSVGSTDSNTATAAVPADFCHQPVPPPGAFSLAASALCGGQPQPSPAVDLTWTASSTVSSYQVFRDGAPASSSFAPQDNSFLSSGLTAGQTYSFFVRASNFQGSTDSNTVSVSVPADICPASPSCPDGTLCLQGGRFQATLTWRIPGSGTSGSGVSAPLSDDTGYFWFFGAGSPELMVKVLDGTVVNGYFWVFYGALSDVEYFLDVTDTATGAAKQYHNPPGEMASVADTSAFAARKSAPGARGAASASAAGGQRAPAAPLGSATAARLATPAAAAAACAPGSASLCLESGRFRVEVGWSLPAGAGSGTAVPLGDGTGYFWFFDQGNAELLVKLLDGRAVNGHFWFFYGALSDVAYIIRVTDTQTGAQRLYQNPAGHLASAADTEAF